MKLFSLKGIDKLDLVGLVIFGFLLGYTKKEGRW